MPKYFCDYCDTHLTHDSPSVRKTHNSGRKHKDSVKLYYMNWLEQEAQQMMEGGMMRPGFPPGGMLPPPGMVPPPGMFPPPMPPGGMMPPPMMGGPPPGPPMAMMPTPGPRAPPQR